MIKQKLILNYASNLILQILQIIGSIVVARIAGATVLGTVAFGTAYVSTFVFIADLGLGTAHIKLVSSADENKLEKYIGTYLIIKLITTSLFIIIFLAFFFIQQYKYHDVFDKTQIIVIYMALAAMSIQQLLSYQNATLAGRLQIAKQQTTTFLQSLFYQIIRISVVLMGFGAVAIAIGNLISALLVIPIYFYLFRNYKVGKFDKSLLKDYFSISIHIILIGVSSKMISSLDKVFLKFFSDSASVGYYTAGFRFAGFIQLIGITVSSIFMPDFSRLFREKNTIEIANKIYKYERFNYIFIMPIAILFAVQSDIIINLLLGTEFTESIPVMSLSTIGLFIYIMAMPYGSVITGFGNFKLAARINISTMVLFIILAMILPNPSIFDLGIKGMTISILLTYLLLSILYKLYSKKYCKEINNFVSIKYLLVGVIFYIIFSFIYTTYINTIDLKIFYPIIELGLIYTIFYIFKMINRDDLKTLKDILNFKSILKYISSELKNDPSEKS